jgi:hypothetical protein
MLRYCYNLEQSSVKSSVKRLEFGAVNLVLHCIWDLNI